METAEVKKEKRVRHLYKKSELYHRFVHDNTYVYSPDNGNQISAVGNYLHVGNPFRYQKLTDIDEYFSIYSPFMIAIIHRGLKRIIITNKFIDYVWELKRAIPDDYKIFLTNKTLDDKDVLLDLEKCHRLHCEYLIEQFVNNNLHNFYSVLTGFSKVLHISLENIKRNSSYLDIIQYVKDNKIKQYSFYKECFNDKYNIRFYRGWNYYWETIKLPTLKQIVTNKVFTKKQVLLLEQYVFYTKYCFGNGIPFKDVVANWNKEITHDEFIRYCNRHSLYQSIDWLVDCYTWNDKIAKVIQAEKKIYEKYIQEQVDKSKQNRQEALAKLDELTLQDYTVEDWRNGKRCTNNQRVEYREYVKPTRRNQSGTWRTSYVSNYFKKSTFDNTQLRLVENLIETSRFAVVPLKDGITLYKLWMLYIKKYGTNINKTFENIKCGIYNLRHMRYITKQTDDGRTLDYKQYLCQVGCHSLWLDDVEDFIRFYHLEDKFDIQQNK